MSKLFREKIYKKVRILRILYIVSTPAIYDQIDSLSDDSFPASIESHKITLNPDGKFVQ